MLRLPPGCSTQDCLGMGKLLPSHWNPLKQAFHLKISFSEDFFFKRNSFVTVSYIESEWEMPALEKVQIWSAVSLARTYVTSVATSPNCSARKTFSTFFLFFLFLAMQSARFGSKLEPGIGSRWASLAGRIFPTRGGLGCGGYGGVRCQWICQLDEHGTFQLLNPSSSDEWFPSEFPPKFAL